MANANYKLTISPLIDTIFENRIGGKKANPNKLEDTLKNVTITEDGIQVKLKLGGIVASPWSLEVVIENGDEEFQTIPKIIKGKIPGNGPSITDKIFKLKKKPSDPV